MVSALRFCVEGFAEGCVVARQAKKLDCQMIRPRAASSNEEVYFISADEVSLDESFDVWLWPTAVGSIVDGWDIM